MGSHASIHPKLRLKSHRIIDEFRSLPVKDQRKIGKALRDGKSASDSVNISTLPLPQQLSKEAVNELQREINQSKGSKEEEKGLQLFAAQEQETASVCKRTLLKTEQDLKQKERDTVHEILQVNGDETLSDGVRAERLSVIQNDLVDYKHHCDVTFRRATKRLRMCEARSMPQLCLSFALDSDNTVVITGRCDQVKASPETITIVEHKRRQKGIFGRVPFYDRIQCLSYMFMLDNAKSDYYLVTDSGQVRPYGPPSDSVISLKNAEVSCVLVETFNEEENEIEIEWDAVLWDDIRNILLERAQILTKVLSDPLRLLDCLESLDGAEVVPENCSEVACSSIPCSMIAC